MKYGVKRAVLTRHMDEQHKHKRENRWADSPDMYYDDAYSYRDYQDMDARFRDRQGREHYNNGRYAPKNELSDHTVPPVYKEVPMNRIGFQYPMDANYQKSSSGHHDQHGEHSSGGIKTSHALTSEAAEEWMHGLRNADGTHGPHWSKEQVSQVMSQHKWDMDLMDAWVALNVIYSDYCKVAKANNVNNMDFYIGMAKAFVDDEDASPEKLALYYEYIVK